MMRSKVIKIDYDELENINTEVIQSKIYTEDPI